MHLAVANLVTGNGRIVVFDPSFERGERLLGVRACVKTADCSGKARDDGERPGVGRVDLAGESRALLP